ncbi:MAG TPA: putative glycoside hydrolase [Spirochaetota bacterium]|nr:putative glycoside hydrolase [Spirochaetota bacterium]
MFKRVIPGLIIFLTITCILITINCTSSANYRVYIATADNGVLISDNEGGSWNSFNKGLPDKILPIKIYKSGEDVYLTTFSSGLFKLNSSNDKWENISSPDFKRRSIYDKNPGYRKISAFTADPENSKNLAVATKHSIYRSIDGGSTWKSISLNGLNKRNYITSISISGNRIYAGTSFNGIFESNGSDFRITGSGLPGEAYSDTLKFSEQSASLYADKENLYAGFYFGSGLYAKKINTKNFIPVFTLKEKNLNSTIYDIRVFNKKLFFSNALEVYMKDESKIYPVEKYNQIIQKISSREDIISATIDDNTEFYPPISIKFPNSSKEKKSEKASNKNAIYASIPAIQRDLNRYINFANNSEVNAIVIDMKDDFGNIYFQSEDKTAVEIKAQKKPINIVQILKKLKENNIYSIARVVVFKDQKLYQAYNGKYAIKNKNTGLPWKGAEGEYWVDPHSEFVHNYNISLAKDLEKLGFDEIQFDYIRFPADGPIQLCNFSYKKDEETYKSEILIDFLRSAKSSLKIPVSIDIYGFNSWYYFGNWIGQDMEELSHVVDAICPMVYPSHFGNKFYSHIEKSLRPYRIVKDGAIRGMQMADKSVSLRPYLQAFNLLSPTWGPEYILYQINASKESGCSGYTLWNAKGDYTVPYSALKKE